MNKALSLVSTTITSAVAGLIVLSIVMALTSCGGQKQYARSKHDWMTKKKHDTAKRKLNKSYTCYEW